MRGGARKGSGRKPGGPKSILASFSLSKEILLNLGNTVPRGQRSKFVEAAIIEKLNHTKMKRFLLIVTLIAAAFAVNLKAAVVERDGYFISDVDAQKMDSAAVNADTNIPAAPIATAPIRAQSPNYGIDIAKALWFLGFVIVGLLMLAFFGYLYFLPTIVACKKRKRNRGAICILNLLTGWSFIGWVASLIWACTEDLKIESPQLIQ